MISFIIIFNIFLTVYADENILCTKDFCKDAICHELSTKCKAQNATHNGVMMLAPTTCNCCQFCLDNLAEGEKCSTGDVSDPVPKEICGPKLYCKPTSSEGVDGVCSRMETICMNLQKDYELKALNGTLGEMEMRQECDNEGEFVPYKCIPGQTCYCVDKNGNRIFGEADFTSIPELEIRCKCSRDYQEATVIFDRELKVSEHFTCSANGDYETIQCLEDKCFCVDAYDGAPTYPDDEAVNVTDISSLKCYKKGDLVYKKCHEEYLGVLKEYEKEKSSGYKLVLGYDFPKCDLDGTYQPVQENSTHKYCVDKEGTILASVDKVNDSKLADSMNCKCVRANQVMTTHEKPKCQLNGNYETIQCRRGKCRCVDENGNQICKNTNCEVDIVDIDTLKC